MVSVIERGSHCTIIRMFILYLMFISQAQLLIHPHRLVLYVILAGLMIWDGQGVYVNTCESLDWRQALGLHLWYATNPISSISDIIDDYTQSFQVRIF